MTDTTNRKIAILRPANQQVGFIKSIGDNAFEGHLVRYSDPYDRDLHKEWFDSTTYFMQNAGYAIKGRPINYQHGMDNTFGNFPLGFYEFADEDEIGLYVRGQLNDREQYVEMLRELGRVKGFKLGDEQLKKKSDIAFKAVQTLLASMPLQQSMGADVATYRVNEDTGHIQQCGIVHGALTPTPADDKNPVVQFKSALAYVTTLENERTTFLMNDPSTNKQPQSVNPAMVNPQSVPVTTSGLQNKDESNLLKTLQEHNLMAKKSLKEMTPEDDEYLRSLIKEIVLELSEESGMEATEDDVLMMTTEMEEEIKQADEEEIKAEMDGEEDDTTKAEDITEEEIAKRVKKYFNANLPSAIKRHLDKQVKLNNKSKSIAQGALSNYKKNAPTVTKKQSVGGYQDNTMTGSINTGVSTWNSGDDVKYAPLTAEQMAMGLKIAGASAFPHGVPRGLKIKQFVDMGIVSNDYMRNMAGKAQQALKADNAFKSHGSFDHMMTHDRVALKSAMPFKADELDAVSITNQGAEWAYIWYDTRLWERARHETKLFNLLASKGMRTADVTGKSMNVKLDTGSPTMYTAPEGRSLDASGLPEVVVQTTPFTTNEVQVDIKKHMLATAFTEELDEDSIINIQAYLDEDLVRVTSETLESALLNGDTTASASNINTDQTPASGIQTPLYIAWDGIRHHVLVDNTGQGNAKAGALEVADYERTKKLFSSTIRNRVDNMLFVIDSDTESHTRRLVQLTTKDVAGDQATIFFGDIPKLFGVELYMSGFLGLSGTTGFISTATPAGNTEGQIICVYAPYWQFGRKRDVTIELTRYPERGATVVVASVRHVFVDRGADAAAMTFDITVSN